MVEAMGVEWVKASQLSSLTDSSKVSTSSHMRDPTINNA